MNEYLFQVLIHRVQDPMEGQRKLDIISQHATVDLTAGVGFKVLKMPGVTRWENPFPDWLQQYLTEAGLEYDDFNLSYQIRTTFADAKKLMVWFEENIRPFCENHPQLKSFIATVTTRIMMPDDTTTLQNLEAY